MLVNNKKSTSQKTSVFFIPFAFFPIHSAFEFVLTVFLSVVNASFEGRDVLLLSAEVADWTDCNSEGD